MAFAANVAPVVLSDCRRALTFLRSHPGPENWRLYWVGTVALLRTVAEALRRVDGRTRSPAAPLPMRQAVTALFATLEASKPEPIIYWQLIDDEANNILHQYRYSAGKEFRIRPPGAAEPAQLAYPFWTGPFKGRDQRND